MADNNDIRLQILSAMKKSHSSFRISVHGDSMQPLISSGDDIVFNRKDKYKIGDIVVFERSDGTVVTHRILFNSNKHAYIKGDSTVAIEKLKSESIIGAVTEVVSGDSSHRIQRGLFLLPVLILSFRINRIWKHSSSFKKAISSSSFKNLHAILLKHR